MRFSPTRLEVCFALLLFEFEIIFIELCLFIFFFARIMITEPHGLHTAISLSLNLEVKQITMENECYTFLLRNLRVSVVSGTARSQQ